MIRKQLDEIEKANRELRAYVDTSRELRRKSRGELAALYNEQRKKIMDRISLRAIRSK